MAIVSMQKMSLVAHESEHSKLLKIFLKSGYVEIIKSEKLDLTSYPNDVKHRDELEGKLLKISFALNFMKEMAKEQAIFDKDNATKVDLKKENRLVDMDEYNEVAKDEVDIFSSIKSMEIINAKLVDIKSERARNIALREQLIIYKDVEIPFNEIKNSNNTIMLIGSIPSNKRESLELELQDYAIVNTYLGEKLSVAIVVAHKDNEEKVMSVLSEHDFIKSSFTYNCTAGEKLAELDSNLDRLEEEKKNQVNNAVSYAEYIKNLKILYDYYGLELSKLDCMAECPHTKKAFIMNGWVPADKVSEIEELVKSKCNKIEITFREPLEDENPPSLCKNDKFTQGFEGITEMFGAPNYRERDPNVFVALFYFLFFGIMISDAGYGLIMAIVCFLIVKITKPVKKSGQMLIMFGLCGISTLIWGALFGGWFAVTIPQNSIFAKLTWFNPIEEPLKMFMLALGLGILQIGTGFALKGISEIKQGMVLRGILNNFSWVVIFIGVYLISPTLMTFLGAINPDPIPEAFATCATIGKYVAIVGAVMLIVGGAVGKKNPIKMVGGALGNVYGSINVVSDVLSYSRLFGLGLTTGVIGYVVNILGGIIVNTFLGGAWYGWIIAAPVLIFGHAFNLGINLLSAYVHNSRLQYIEFFGRFYEGTGHAFKPLGSTTKYTYFNN
jgi:V/A-type H+-transporting ATPase subunit I